MRGIGCNCRPIVGAAHGWDAHMASGGIAQREEGDCQAVSDPE